MVDRDDIHREIGVSCRYGHWTQLFPPRLAPLTFRHRTTRIKPSNAPYHGAIIRSGQWMLRKAPSDLLEQGCQGRWLRRQVELLDADCEELFWR